MKRILISVGDYSGEVYALEILQRLQKVLPSAQFFSLTRGIISSAGAIPISSVSNIGVVGLTEVLEQLKKLLTLFSDLWHFFDQNPPDVVILIDYPDMNLNIIARLAKRKGARVLYFIPPQVWAWRRGRVRLLKRLVDEMIVILPFEQPFYLQQGIENVHYFGHPLIDKIAYQIATGSRDEQLLTVGILPGSRLSEWRHHIPIANRVVESLSTIYPDAQFLLPVARSMEKNVGAFSLSPLIRLVFGSASESAADQVFSRSHCALVASGTATLEAALWGVPMVVFYRVSPLSTAIGRKVINVPFISLPNLVSGEKIVPEFVDAKSYEVGEIVKAMQSLIDGFRMMPGGSADSEWASQKKALMRVKDSLGTPPVMDKIALHIANFIRS